MFNTLHHKNGPLRYNLEIHSFLLFRKFDTSSICGIQLGPVPHSCIIFSNLTRCILHALPGKSSKTFSQTAPHVAVSSFVYSIYGMGSPLKINKNQLSKGCLCIYSLNFANSTNNHKINLLFEIERNVSNILSSFSISPVFPSRVIHIQFGLKFCQKMITVVQIINVPWKPRA